MKYINNLSTDQGVIEGYAIKFGERSKKLGNFYEIIDHHALDHVDLSKVKMLADHDTSKVLGSVENTTLKLEIDKVGLKFRVEIPKTTYASDLYELVQRGDVNQCSFGFTVNEKDRSAQKVSRLEDGIYLRVVKKIETLKEISIVSFPAYDGTIATTVKRDFDNVIQQFELEKLNTELELLSL